MHIGTFVALGDSFTEGLDDPRADQGGYRGWADRVAEEQVPQAIAMSPDLVSVAAGGNDLLRLRADPDVLARSFDDAIRTLLMTGCQVLIFTGFDPKFPVLRLIRGR